MQYLEIPDQPPARFAHESRRHFSGNPFNKQIRPQPLEYIDDEVDVLRQFEGQEVLWMGVMFCLHPGPADKLQLVELDRQQRQTADRGSLLEQHLSGLAWQSQYEMGPDVESSLRAHADSPFRRCEIMSPVDPFESPVVA